ncbi:MAG: class I tRNA ligase family protein, partial [Clostridia bacterium]|nr:class I tRNA ligase family protein [Clostridia bacterium]
DRCKKPIIFRATPQWFCSVESFKDQAIKAIENVEWFPAWGEDRMISMIRERADWCISRQRRWGLPIPVFYCADCGKPVSTPESIDKISALFDEHGSNIWFEKTAMELVPDGFTCPHCGGKTFEKEKDTLDCWFDSGSTHFASLMKDCPELWPADVYLEGADQYRGWFQSSLLTSVGALDQGAPFRQVLTHGWVVDGQGRAMHKSLGNGVDPADLIKEFGADILRLWVASSDYHVDVRCSKEIFKQLSDAYRKLRNTARILMGNLNDFNPETDMVANDALHDIDKWMLASLNELVKTCVEAYDRYEFHIISHEVVNFCTVELSKLYVDITKDRLYTERADSTARRAAQTAMFRALTTLARLIAPLLAHTSEEIWQAMPHTADEDRRSVLLNSMPTYDEALGFDEVKAHYDRLFELRDDVMKALEIARADKQIGKSLDAKITVYCADDETKALLDSFGDELKVLFMVSGVALSRDAAAEGAHTDCVFAGIAGVLVEQADGHRCDRCWMYTEAGQATEDGFLCDRCRAAIE